MTTSSATMTTGNPVRRRATKRRSWIWTGGILGVVALGAFFFFRGGSTASANEPTLKVQRGELALEVVETGRIEPLERVELKSKVAGQVLQVLVNEGDEVKKDQVLLRLDPIDFQREVARARAEVELARSALSYAELMLERRQRALSERGASQSEVDLSVSDAQGKRAQLKLAQVALAAAEDRLRYTEIRAPLDGTVLERGVEPGEVVSPGVQATFEGKALLTVGNLSTLIVKADLNQIDVAKVKVGQAVTLTLDSLPGESFDAEVTQVAPAAIKLEGKAQEVFPIEARLKQANEALRPGMTADVRIGIEKKPAVLSVPIEAVLKEEGKSFVTRLAMVDGKPTKEKVPVRTGVRNDRDIEIVDGIAEGDELVINPASASANEAK